MTQAKVLTILEDRLISLQIALDHGQIEPNFPQKEGGRDHVYQVIAGAGKHSKDGFAKLKLIIPVWLTDAKYDFVGNHDQGQFLVHLVKNWLTKQFTI